jgi:hypothetical protein
MKAVAEVDGVTAGAAEDVAATTGVLAGGRAAHPATPISTGRTASSGIAKARIMAFIMPRQTPQMTRIDQDRVVAAATGPPDGR